MAVVDQECFSGFGEDDLFDLWELGAALGAVDYEG